jgi:hypothetical protein
MPELGRLDMEASQVAIDEFLSHPSIKFSVTRSAGGSMKKPVRVGRWFNLEISFDASILAAYAGLAVVLAVLAGWLLHMAWATALLFGLAGSFLHAVSDLIHQLGHAWAARRSGYPMVGLHFWGIFSTSIYPANEPVLPRRIHIRRALGGPAVSALFALLAWLWAFWLPSDTPAWWLAWFVFADNLVVFTLQMFIPLGFNDGGTLWYWLRHQE